MVSKAFRTWLIDGKYDVYLTPSSIFAKQLIQPARAAELFKFMGETLISKPQPHYAEDFLNELQLRTAVYAAAGSRENHRHGACLYLRVDEVLRRLTDLDEDGRYDALKKMVEGISEDASITFGRNTEILTKGWKGYTTEKEDKKTRWKIMHAEISAMIEAACHPLLRELFLAPQCSLDVEETEFGLIDRKIQLRPQMEELIKQLSALKMSFQGCLGVLVVELDNNEIHYCSSQACPMCVKGLIRWGISEQIYTTGDLKIRNREKVICNEALVCESLRGCLCHYASTCGEPESKKRKSSSINNVLRSSD